MIIAGGLSRQNNIMIPFIHGALKSSNLNGLMEMVSSSNHLNHQPSISLKNTIILERKGIQMNFGRFVS
jgi:hypothetical protein